MMSDATTQALVSEAIARCVGQAWSGAMERNLTEHYGPELAAMVQAVYEAAMDCPVDWQHASMDAALATLADFLASQFPWLSPAARTQLNYCYIMVWK